MKKIKLMLLSLSILAVVGGALAFTIKTGTHYCTADTVLVNGKITCPAICQTEAQTTPGAVGDNVCTTTTNGNASDPCSGSLPCFKTNPNSTIE